MTKEEATEVILGGSPFITCQDCMGMGYSVDTSGVEEKSQVKPLPCAPCRMLGQVLRPHYKRACRVLGRPMPKLKMRRMDDPAMKTPLRMAVNQGVPIKQVMNTMEALGILPHRSLTKKSR